MTCSPKVYVALNLNTSERSLLGSDSIESSRIAYIFERSDGVEGGKFVSCHFSNGDIKQVHVFLFIAWISFLLLRICAAFELNTSEYVQSVYLFGTYTNRVSVPMPHD